MVLWTAEAGDRVVLLWVSVVGDTRPGGVEDSYPELAAGEESDAGGEASWTWRKHKYMFNRNLLHAHIIGIIRRSNPVQAWLRHPLSTRAIYLHVFS